MKILAIVKFNDRHAYVLDRKPEFVYQRLGDNVLFAQDGFFVNTFIYDRPSKNMKAFAGREFDLPMIDGSVTKCNGQWWAGGIHEAEKKLGVKLVHCTSEDIESLRNCYVFTGCSAIEDELLRAVGEYQGPIYEYWEYGNLLKG